MRYGSAPALWDVSLAIGAGELVSLVGPNGAGKTTLVNIVTRLYKPDSGELELDGRSLLRTPAHRGW